MELTNMHLGPNGACNDVAPATSFDSEVPGILKNARFIPKDLETFDADREKVLSIGSGQPLYRDQYGVGIHNSDKGTEDYGTQKSAY